jgi:hypothetical protein
MTGNFNTHAGNDIPKGKIVLVFTFSLLLFNPYGVELSKVLFYHRFHRWLPTFKPYGLDKIMYQFFITKLYRPMKKAEGLQKH